MAGVLVWAAAGCSSVVEGAAEPASGQEGLFDPCKDIPDSVLEEVGLDPATEEVDIAGVEQPGWKICSWTESWYYLSIFSTESSIETTKQNPNYVGFKPVTIGQRDGVEFHLQADADLVRCFVALPAAQGAIWLSVDTKLALKPEGSTCELTQHYASLLDQRLPS
ncbi:DUF3558 domain-containing protein [Rhodococcus qingshengii]|uniref:DUF3558 domain-containing protein n=1 Tax=Rhodococcus qingshengii TaxID=334542 RepID=UPI000E4B39C7|nr:DUF3558 domain-containing protein [Rhodococcus qingshengii]QPG91544.1 DUF3558 domain-containing protein [Rhodococcus qingshengii]THJ71103.1 DUF3558 domain-containing protein [Rhodococcus qingshengii]